MTSLLRSMKLLLGALVVASFTGVASAEPIDLDQWYTFGFFDPVGPLVGSAGFILGQRSEPLIEAPWTFDCPQTPANHCKLIVTDGFIPVDQFELFDFGVSLGLTSAPSGDTGHTCGNDEVACLLDAQMSHGIFNLAVGAHSITGLHVAGIPGAGFLIVRVPEPSTVLLIALGLVAFGVARRRA